MTTGSSAQQVQRGGQEPQLAGISVSAFTCDLIYRQVMTPLKVSMLATKISTVYCEISTDYILPAQRWALCCSLPPRLRPQINRL
ncbi:hypothetical protein B0H19DRAFT_1273572 [Mycena capillaripes]|nr:hypothetical protein B0H19DRAFT_1273572 [Mycena capillaripes]